jgi:hypothetical protein
VDGRAGRHEAQEAAPWMAATIQIIAVMSPHQKNAETTQELSTS